MTTTPDSFSENELHAYVDGQLTPERRAQAEAWLAEHPEKAAEVAAWQAQNAAIRAAFGAEPVLGAQDRALVAGLAKGGRRRWSRYAVAAGFALFFLAGGGAAYIHAARALNDGAGDGDTDAARAAAHILRIALAAPAMRIAANAGHDGRLVAARIADTDGGAYGFDAARGRYGDLIRAGVIDPAAVAIAALEAAVSVAGLLLTAEAVIAKPPPPPRPTRADDIPFGPEAKDMTAEEAGDFGLV